MLVVAAQIVSSATIDQFGLFGAPQKPIDLLRLVGLLIMVVGVVIAQYAANSAKRVRSRRTADRYWRRVPSNSHPNI